VGNIGPVSACDASLGGVPGIVINRLLTVIPIPWELLAGMFVNVPGQGGSAVLVYFRPLLKCSSCVSLVTLRSRQLRVLCGALMTARDGRDDAVQGRKLVWQRRVKLQIVT
jgi:hypothetical protein